MATPMGRLSSLSMASAAPNDRPLQHPLRGRKKSSPTPREPTLLCCLFSTSALCSAPSSPVLPTTSVGCFFILFGARAAMDLYKLHGLARRLGLGLGLGLGYQYLDAL
eukprot:6173102-Pleurochrysis_carterae.AAC.1